MRVFSAQETAAALPYSLLVDELARAAGQLAAGKINAPERLVVQISATATHILMPCVAEDIGVTKLVNVHRQNYERNLPGISGEVIVYDSDTGERLALLDGPMLTARRTAAMTLLGIRSLLPKAPRAAVIIGTGAQAAAHAVALSEFFHVANIAVSGLTLGDATSFCERLAPQAPSTVFTPISSNDLEFACSRADVVIALTTSTRPVIPENLPETTLAVGVGAFQPDMAEIPMRLLHNRRVVVDHLVGTKAEAGDLIQAHIDWAGVDDIAKVVARGARAGPVGAVFKTVGHAAWDLAAARVALRSTGLRA